MNERDPNSGLKRLTDEQRDELRRIIGTQAAPEDVCFLCGLTEDAGEHGCELTKHQFARLELTYDNSRAIDAYGLTEDPPDAGPVLDANAAAVAAATPKPDAVCICNSSHEIYKRCPVHGTCDAEAATPVVNVGPDSELLATLTEPQRKFVREIAEIQQRMIREIAEGFAEAGPYWTLTPEQMKTLVFQDVSKPPEPGNLYEVAMEHCPHTKAMHESWNRIGRPAPECTCQASIKLLTLERSRMLAEVVAYLRTLADDRPCSDDGSEALSYAADDFESGERR